MNEPLDEQYFKWLYHQVASVRLKSPARTYWSLLGMLHCKEFVWLIPNDDNRAEDGRDLRQEFVAENDVRPDSAWMSLGCSMLEMMIGLSRRLSFDTEGESRDWFWQLVQNLDLHLYTDLYFKERDRGPIEDILDSVIWRTYEADGHGGLFPVDRPIQDMKDVELWYQMSMYLFERA